MATWILRVTSQLQPAIEHGEKTLELRIRTERNVKIISEMMRYRIGDELIFEFAGAPPLRTQITDKTYIKKFGALTDEEIELITGNTISQSHLKNALEQLYRRPVNENDECAIASFVHIHTSEK